MLEQIEIAIKYAGYIDKQHEQAARVVEYESLQIPAETDFAAVTGLSFEARQTLSVQRPQTLGQASRMSGMTPAAVSLLLVHLKKKRSPSSRGDSAAVERSAA